MGDKKIDMSKYKPKPALSLVDIDNLKLGQEKELTGERFYAREFKKILSVRGLLLELNRARNKTITNEQAYFKALEFVESVTPKE